MNEMHEDELRDERLGRGDYEDVEEAISALRAEMEWCEGMPGEETCRAALRDVVAFAQNYYDTEENDAELNDYLGFAREMIAGWSIDEDAAPQQSEGEDCGDPE